MSDIHGEKEAFEDALSVVDFSDGNMLVLCGDYLDRFRSRPEFLTYIKELQERHEGQVVVLMGNHEASYIEEVVEGADSGLTNGADGAFCGEHQNASLLDDRATLAWLKDLPLYYETENQIFVHAGVDEEAGEYWKVGTEDSYFYSKFPQTYGAFSKDIVAGHVETFSMCGEHRVFWDGQSHLYIDGTTEQSKLVPVLKYDTETGDYTSFEKVEFSVGARRWSEYVVKPGGGRG